MHDLLFYPLAKAARLLNCSEGDLIQYGSMGRLPVYILIGDFVVMPRWLGGSLSFYDKSILLSKLGVKKNLAKLDKACLHLYITGERDVQAFIENRVYPYKDDDGIEKCGLLNFGIYYKDRLVNPSDDDLARNPGFSYDCIFDSLQEGVLLRDCDLVIKSEDLEKLRQSQEGPPIEPWWISNPSDPPAEHKWWTPARYFARAHRKDNETHTVEQLACMVERDLKEKEIYAQGKKGAAPVASSILKALGGIPELKKNSKSRKRF